jgi:hypothetical protein
MEGKGLKTLASSLINKLKTGLRSLAKESSSKLFNKILAAFSTLNIAECMPCNYFILKPNHLCSQCYESFLSVIYEFLYQVRVKKAY